MRLSPATRLVPAAPVVELTATHADWRLAANAGETSKTAATVAMTATGMNCFSRSRFTISCFISAPFRPRLRLLECGRKHPLPATSTRGLQPGTPQMGDEVPRPLRGQRAAKRSDCVAVRRLGGA